MTQVCVVAEAESVRANVQGPVTGNIWILFKECEFPMRGWNDFAVVILGWWAAALLRLVRNETNRETVNFMDGSYAVEVRRSSNGMLRFRALEGPARLTERTTGTAQVGVFVNGLVSQSSAVLSACRERGGWSSDEETLQSQLDALQREARALLS